MAKDFWSEFQVAAGVFCLGEASRGNITYTAEYQGPLNSILNYPLYYTMKRVFTGNQSMKTLTTTVDQEVKLPRTISAIHDHFKRMHR